MTHRCPGLPPHTFNGQNCEACKTSDRQTNLAQLGAYALLHRSCKYEIRCAGLSELDSDILVIRNPTKIGTTFRNYLAALIEYTYALWKGQL